MISDMMDDAMDTATGEGVDEAADEEIDRVVAEITAGQFGTLSSAPTGRVVVVRYFTYFEMLSVLTCARWRRAVWCGQPTAAAPVAATQPARVAVAAGGGEGDSRLDELTRSFEALK
jgi:hypothetical protein